MALLPEFHSYFESISKMACFSGIVLIKRYKDFGIFDYFLIIFGVVLTINNIIALSFIVCFFSTQSLSLLDIVTKLPLLVFATEGTVKYLFLMINRTVIHGLLNELQELYATTWKYQGHLVEQLETNRFRIRKFLLLAVILQSVFAYTPVVITAAEFFILRKWNLLQVHNIWYPFDIDNHWFLVYCFELNASRYSAFNIVLPDGLMLMMIIQINYHFECLGHEIIERVKVKSQLTENESLKDCVKIHIKLLE